MIVELIGLAGVGKHTVGKMLAERLHARLIDNHTIYNPAFASTLFRTDAFYETVRAVRAITFGQAERLPEGEALILTTAPGRNMDWSREWQEAVRALADARGVPLLGVHLLCSAEEGAERIAQPARAMLRKVIDPSAIYDGVARPVLLDHCDISLELDTTELNPDETANAILDWLDQPRE